MLRNAKKDIDLIALQHNFQCIQQLAPHSKIMVMLKAHAYGHGDIAIANTLSRADAFGVAHLNEALRLREAGIRTPITIFSGYLTPDQLPLLVENHIQWVIHAMWQVELLQKTTLHQPLSVWLKLDTGMHRLGFTPHTAPIAWQALQQCRTVQKPIPLMTHFACADEPTHPATAQQITLFQQITQAWPGARSLANSAGILAWPTTHADWIRPGLMIYGISPFAGKTGADHGLKPVMRLKAPLIARHDCAAGDTIGYGSTYTCPQAMPVGVIGIGYGDGYPRHAPSGTPVYLNGQIVPLIGRVSMDMITVDLSNTPNACIGDEAVLWGPELPVEIISQKTGVLTYELLTHT